MSGRPQQSNTVVHHRTLKRQQKENEEREVAEKIKVETMQSTLQYLEKTKTTLSLKRKKRTIAAKFDVNYRELLRYSISNNER